MMKGKRNASLSFTTTTFLCWTLLSSAGLAFQVHPKNIYTPKVVLEPDPLAPADDVSSEPSGEQRTEKGRLKRQLEKKLLSNVNAPAHDKTIASVQGGISKDPSQNRAYASEIKESNPELHAKLQTLTKERPYPLFLLEKATKILSTGHRKKDKTSAVNAANKEKLVILGAGWASASLLADIDNDLYDVTIISPRNYFLFTPMLASSSVGTVDIRSITRPIREFNRQAEYLEAAASSIDVDKRQIICHGVTCSSDDECEISETTIPYDRLVVAVGAKVNTFGIPGVEEHCFFLKQVADARAIRRKVVDLFEKASFPGLDQDEISKLLTFAIIGAGPTGVEFGAELRDFVEQDGAKYYPHLLKYVKIKIIEASGAILPPFDDSLKEAAVKSLTRNLATTEDSETNTRSLIEVATNKRVERITRNSVELNDGSSLPYGLAVWAGGIGPLPITTSLIETIGGQQAEVQKVARGKLAVDPWLRVLGGNGRVFALGDCSCTQSACLPSNAQVASQQGEFLAHVFNNGNMTAEFEGELLLPPRKRAGDKQLSDSVASLTTRNPEYMAPFQLLDMGILAYTGSDSALAQVQADKTRIKATGKFGFGLWRSVYFMKQASVRNRFLVGVDWIKARIFGRDITAID